MLTGVSRANLPGMTPRRARFVKEYLIDLNATKAAIRAGFSAKTAGSMGGQLLQNIEIQREIAKEQEKKAKKLDITSDRILRELALIAFADTTKVVRVAHGVVYVTEDSELEDDTRPAIAEISQSAVGAIKVRMHDKVAALKLIGDHLGTWNKGQSPEVPLRVEIVGADV